MQPDIIRSYLNKLENILNEVTMEKNAPGTSFLVSNSADGKKMREELMGQGLDIGSGKVTYLDISSIDVSNVPYYGKVGSKAYAFETETGEVFVCYKQPPVTYIRGTADALKLTSAGETAEGILGAAMYAKFIKRQTRERIGDVTAEDVFDALQSIHAAPGDSVTGKSITTTVKDASGKNTDNVSFQLILKTVPYNDLMNPAMRPLLTPYVNSAIGYVNGELAEEYARYFYLNDKKDDIAVISAGPQDEKTSKADVKLVIRSEDGKVVNSKLNVSLKVGGIEQFGQVYGTNAETIVGLYKYLGADISDKIPEFDELKKKDTKTAIQFLYDSAEREMTRQLANESKDTEARFIDSLVKGIIHFATLGNPDVELVDFDKGKFKIMRFGGLLDKMQGIQLVVSCPSTTAQPVLLIADKNNPSKRLIKVRCKIEKTPVTKAYPDGFRVRHYVEKGRLLEELTAVEYNKVEKPDVDKIDDKIDAIASGASTSSIRPTRKAPVSDKPRAKR